MPICNLYLYWESISCLMIGWLNILYLLSNASSMSLPVPVTRRMRTLLSNFCQSGFVNWANWVTFTYSCSGFMVLDEIIELNKRLMRIELVDLSHNSH